MDPVSQPPGSVAEWHYVGHYGQLGPLTLNQIEELVLDGVIDRDTFVWQTGMSDWVRAIEIPRLGGALQRLQPPPPVPSAAPPIPGFGRGNESAPFAPALPPAPAPMSPTFSQDPLAPYGSQFPTWANYGPVSDKSRLLAGVLQLLIPGVGRMYLGYAAQGVMQLLLTPFGCLVGWIWSIIDGILILSGSVQHDGYGRRLNP